MSTLPSEQSGLPGEKDPLLEPTSTLEGRESFLERVRKRIKGNFPRADLTKIKLDIVREKGEDRARAKGKRGGVGKPIFKKDGSGYMKAFLDSFHEELGSRAEDIISVKTTEIRQERQQLKEEEQKLKETERAVANEQELEKKAAKS